MEGTTTGVTGLIVSHFLFPIWLPVFTSRFPFPFPATPIAHDGKYRSKCVSVQHFISLVDVMVITLNSGYICIYLIISLLRSAMHIKFRDL